MDKEDKRKYTDLLYKVVNIIIISHYKNSSPTARKRPEKRPMTKFIMTKLK